MTRQRSVVDRVVGAVRRVLGRGRRPAAPVPFPEVEANARRQADYGDSPSAM